MSKADLRPVICSVHFLVSWVFQMSTLEQRLAAITDTTSNLIAQLRELNRLRERVRKAKLSAGNRIVHRRAVATPVRVRGRGRTRPGEGLSGSLTPPEQRPSLKDRSVMLLRQLTSDQKIPLSYVVL